jgi:CheY-like chemotaxis protein
MLVDDETDLLAITTKWLEKGEYSVHGFADPIKALEHLNSGCMVCSIVVSDIRMPGMGGFELVRQVKVLRPEIKVILMTAFKINQSEAQLVLPSTKVDAFLKKPFKTAELIEAIKNATPPNITIN